MNYLSQNIQNALNQLGVATPQDIAQIGAVKAFLLLKELDLTLTKSVLWRLDATARGVSLGEIDDTRKQQLSGSLNNHPPVAIFPSVAKMQHFMSIALAEAQKAAQQGEVPVGAVVVQNGTVIATAHNTCEKDGLIFHHAEINALTQAAKVCGTSRLCDCDLYITLEPCLMCAGAIMHARIRRLIFAAYEPKTGVAGSLKNVFADKKLNHHTAVLGEICKKDAQNVLKAFFSCKR
ncbi:MAG: tRNA-specific adenosine deaminase [Neisseriaceae bacterium]|nr:tRNA-specific adenosine deaminase [Neisseriaceae bacterium]